MSDDHAAGAVGTYQSRLSCLNPTPNIDRLAKEGMIFKQAFCHNSICTPSRANIMTGQYSQTNGVLDLWDTLPSEKQYLAIEMKKAGYLTAVIGKWHLGTEPNFDYYEVLPVQGRYFNPEFQRKGNGKWPDNLVKYEGMHSTDAITDISIQWLRHRDKSRPFFLMHHFKAPHDMFENAPRYNDYLEDVYIPEPASLYYQPEHGSVATRGYHNELIHKIGSSVSKRNVIRNMGRHMNVDPNLKDPEYAHQAYQKYLKRYLRCVKGIDDNLGRLFRELESEKILDDTVIVYTSDQGLMLGEHDYIDKRWMYEESMRMPLLIRFPKLIRGGSVCDLLINNTDYAPTLLALAGVRKPDYMQGMSFADALSGKDIFPWRKGTYYRYWMHMADLHSNPAHFGIRTRDYKLIFFYGVDYKDRPADAQAWKDGDMFNTQPGWEFYDLRMDPEEMKNIYTSPQYVSIIKELKEELQSLRSELHETDDKYPKIQDIIKERWSD